MASEMDLNTFQGKIFLDGKITAQHDWTPFQLKFQNK